MPPLRLLPPLTCFSRTAVSYRTPMIKKIVCIGESQLIFKFLRSLTAKRSQFMTAPIGAPVSPVIVSALTEVYLRSRYLVCSRGFVLKLLVRSRGFESKSAHPAAKFMPTREPHGGFVPKYSTIQGLYPKQPPTNSVLLPLWPTKNSSPSACHTVRRR